MKIKKKIICIFAFFLDSRSDNNFLVSTPFPILLIVASYIYLSHKAGPEWMKKREPFNLRSAIIVYNLFQVLANVGLFFYVCISNEFSNLNKLL